MTMADMDPKAIKQHATCLAAFKRPRYVAYVQDFPRTATNKIAKSQITQNDVDGDVFDLASEQPISKVSAAALFE